MIVFLPVALLLAQSGWNQFYLQSEDSYRKGDLPEAARLAQLALNAAGSAGEKGASLDRLGFLQYQLGKRAEAETLLKQALEIRAGLGRETEGYADTALNLAMLFRDMRRLEEALKFATEGSAIRAKLLGRSHPGYAESLNVLGSVEANLENFPKALATYEEGLAIHEAQLDPQNPSEEYGTLCTNFANIALRAGKYQKASELFGKGLRALEKKPGKGHPAYSATLAGAAFLEQELGNFEKAEQMHVEARTLLVQQLGEFHPVVGIASNNLGVLYQMLGNPSAAEAAYRQSLAVKRKVAEKSSLALTIRNLGRLVFERDPAEAEKMYREAIGLFEQAANPLSYEVGNTLLSLAEAQRTLGSLHQSAATLGRAKEMISRSLAQDHPLQVHVLHESALLAEAQGDPKQAAELYRKAIDLAVSSRGSRHPQVARSAAALARLYTREGQFAAAYPLFKSALEIQDGVRSQLLAVGSEAAKSAMLANLDDLAPAVIEFQNRAAAAVPEARRLAFEAVTSRKARALDFIREWRGKLRKEAGEPVRTLLDEWQAIVECEATLSVAAGYRDWRRPPAGGCTLEGTALAGRYDRLSHELRGAWSEKLGRQAKEAIEDLHERAAQLEERLSRELPSFGQGAVRVSTDAIRAGLQPDELLLEVVHYEGRYGAFLLDAEGGLDWMELGAARRIDTATADILEAANDWSDALSAGERAAVRAAEQTATRAIDGLSRESFAPLWKALATRRARRLSIASDGMLLLLPFEALTDGGGPLLRGYAVSYVLSGRDLAHRGAPLPAPGPALIAVSPGPSARRPTPGAVFRTGKLERLAGARREARQLSAIMPNAVVLGEGEATEQALKQVTSPALLHVIGHGLVRGKECAECPAGGSDPSSRIMNLSAIVMEEAYGRGKASGQDGLLTASELRSLNLSSTAMLVLSQCRMADGVPTSGDGVYGMRRAASLAGARTFVAPLWKVADSTQQTLMGRFYQELRAGEDRAEALRRAKLQVRAGAGHFFHWAAVILSGSGGPLPAGLFALTERSAER